MRNEARSRPNLLLPGTILGRTERHIYTVVSRRMNLISKQTIVSLKNKNDSILTNYVCVSIPLQMAPNVRVIWSRFDVFTG